MATETVDPFSLLLDDTDNFLPRVEEVNQSWILIKQIC